MPGLALYISSIKVTPFIKLLNPECKQTSNEFSHRSFRLAQAKSKQRPLLPEYVLPYKSSINFQRSGSIVLLFCPASAFCAVISHSRYSINMEIQNPKTHIQRYNVTASIFTWRHKGPHRESDLPKVTHRVGSGVEPGSPCCSLLPTQVWQLCDG